MAENAWGRQPPIKKSTLKPGDLQHNFWGKAPVPDQVRGQPRVDDWVDPDATEFVWESVLGPDYAGNFRATAREQEAGEHESWVSGEAKRGDFESPVEGDGQDGSFRATAREQGTGEHESWVGGTPVRGDDENPVEGDGQDGSFRAAPLEKGDTSENPIEGEGVDGSFQANSRPQGPGDNDSVDPIVRVQLPGEHESWVHLFRDPGTTQLVLPQGEGRDGSSSSEAREQGAGDHESWVSGEAKRGGFESPIDAWTQDMNSKAEGRAQGDGEADSWVGAFVREQGAGDSESWVDGFVRPQLPTSDDTFVGGDPKRGDYSSTVNPINASGSRTVGPNSDAPSGAVSWNPAPVAAGTRTGDPFVGQWNFKVEINGIETKDSKFLSVSGITSETEMIEYKYSGDAYTQAIPGKYKFSNVELTRVYRTQSDVFLSWRENIENGQDDFRDVTIHLYHVDLDDGPVMSMILHQAMPVKWEFPELNASSSDAAIEKITLVVARITRSF